MTSEIVPKAEESTILRLNTQRKRVQLIQAGLFIACLMAALSIALPAASGIEGFLAASVWPLAAAGYGAYVGLMLRYSLPLVRLVSFSAPEGSYPRGRHCKECGHLLRQDHSCPLCEVKASRPLVILFGSVLPWAAPLPYLLLQLPIAKASGIVIPPLLLATALAACALCPVIALAIHLMAAKPWRKPIW